MVETICPADACDRLGLFAILIIKEATEAHLARAACYVLRIAKSFAPEERLCQTFLAAAQSDGLSIVLGEEQLSAHG
jgi:hypothetical protein